MDKKIWTGVVLILWLLSLSSPAVAQLKYQRPFPFTPIQLKNGLEVVLVEDDSLPIVTVAVAYKVGALHEPAGKAGLALLLENMLMFQGSRNVGRMQHVSIIQRIGGRFNASTERDRTVFYQTVPSHHLATVLWLESDRMLSLEINPTGVDRWTSTLTGQMKNRAEQDPYLNGSLIFDAFLYPDLSYSHSIRGDEADLSALSAADVRNFYETYYRPDNAVLCVVGDLQGGRAPELIRRYFQNLSPGKIKIPELITPDADIKTQDIHQNVESPQASYPAFFWGYRIPPFRSDDFYALSLIEYILLKGNSARLFKRLTDKDRLASRLVGGIDIRHDQAAFRLFISSSNELKLEQSQKEIQDEINKLKTNRVSERELLKAKSVFKSDYIKRYATTVDKALFLANAYVSGIGWEDLSAELDEYLGVTASRIQWVMARYFKESVLINIKTR
jgi:zinc protease